MYIGKIFWPTAPRILDILILLILQDKTLTLEASNIVCWLVNQPITKLDLFKSPDCRWICKTYVEYCYRNSATVCRLVQSPTLQSTIFCSVHSDLRSKGIRVSPAWRHHVEDAQKKRSGDRVRSCSVRFLTQTRLVLLSSAQLFDAFLYRLG